MERERADWVRSFSVSRFNKTDARMEVNIYEAALPLRKKRSGTKFVKYLTKYRRFLRGFLRY